MGKIELLCRGGYVARGIVYVLLGALALTSAFAGGGKEVSSDGVFATILGEPFGRILLAIIAVGLAGHVVWRLVQAFLNADRRSASAKGYLARFGNLASAAVNAALAYGAARLAIGAGGAGGGGEESLAAWLMQQSFGRLLVALLGAAVLVAGGVHIWRGISRQYCRWVELPPQQAPLLKLVCSFGLSARGLLIGMIGALFVYAAFVVDAGQAGGTAEALDWVRQLPFGRLIYLLAAVGLVAFGVYNFVAARYRRMAVPDAAEVKHAARKVVAPATP